MEITGRTLREVEFRDRLRGYDTDEVDEFLEKVAVGIDELSNEVARLAERSARAERQAEDAPAALDDESIRRTLVLAQRTADLAIKEARSEADRIIADAQESARRLRSEADMELGQTVARMVAEKEDLERELHSLAGLVDAEKRRIADSLAVLQNAVSSSMNLSNEATSALASTARHSGTTSAVNSDDPFGLGLPDVEREIAEDAEVAYSGPIGSTPVGANYAPDPLDPDEELWQRWAKSAEVTEAEPVGDPFNFGDGEENPPA